ncbi:hypothetical protein [Flavobacterium sp. ZT3R18]|uniref:hypothetical protein n=1 Tax=Flavobacterium sp. ZT3R18 TaxID=2594429 RepID=UPI00117A0571|nr:hypothetical protein [Flavobacterium sp. ZT3R18]
MKIFVKIVLFFFVLFLVTPVIVEWVEKDKARTSLCVDDDTNSSIEEVKLDLKFYTSFSFSEILFFDLKKASGLIIFENLSKHDLICASIFIPPPNKV